MSQNRNFIIVKINIKKLNFKIYYSIFNRQKINNNCCMKVQGDIRTIYFVAVKIRTLRISN